MQLLARSRINPPMSLLRISGWACVSFALAGYLLFLAAALGVTGAPMSSVAEGGFLLFAGIAALPAIAVGGLGGILLKLSKTKTPVVA